MLKRQDIQLSSSSRRDTPPPPPPTGHRHAKSIGCMSGILHLLSKHRNRRKFLTLGKKQEKNAQFSRTTKRDRTDNQREKEETRDDHRQRLSQDVVQRSPTIPSEIRQKSSPESFRFPPTLLPCPMGLPEFPPKSECHSDTTEEERRKLLRDLEKCDEDLKALKKIIESVRFAEHFRTSPSPVAVMVIGKREGGGNDDNVNITSNEQPSPVSVLDELNRWPLIRTAVSIRQSTTTNDQILALPQLQNKPMPRKKPGEDDALYSLFFQKVIVESKRNTYSSSSSPPPPWSSKAMVESVEEVCKDIAWGEKREVGRIGLVIHDYICRDLIEEIVKDLAASCCLTIYSLPFQACQRRLCF